MPTMNLIGKLNTGTQACTAYLLLMKDATNNTKTAKFHNNYCNNISNRRV